jgi:transposase
MLGKTDPQVNFFDSYIEEYFLLKIKENVDFSFIEEETKDLYAKEIGRPSHPPVVMFRILFLEFYYNLSDVEVVKQLKFNVLFRYFVGLKVEDSIPDDTSLVVFRRRLGEERFERLFDRFAVQCKDKDLLQEKLKAIDATHIIADIAIPNTVNLLREGRKRILRAIEKEKKGLADPLKKYLPTERPSRRSTKEDLVREVSLSKDLIKEIKGKHSSIIEKIVGLLEKAVEPEKKRKLVSFVDPDARFGTRFAGYKAHIAKDESEIITSAEILPGDENEGEESNLETLLQKEDEKGLTAEAVACDALYDSLANRLNIEKRGMKHYIPEKRKKKKLDDFIYSENEDKFICWKGYSSIGKTYYKDAYVYYFSARVCKSCDRTKECPCGKNRPTLYVSQSHLLYIKADPEEKKKALRKRRRIEAKFGEAKKHHAIVRARYRSRWRVAIQVFMTFIVMNLKRMVKLLERRGKTMRLALPSG